MPGFDSTVWFYDPLSRMVYGNALLRAQAWLVDAISTGANVLIVGGGTGWMLEEMARKKKDVSITYVEASSKMMARARNRNAGDNTVTFITQKIEDTHLENKAFDVVFTPFLFDNFTEAVAENLFDRIDTLLAPGGTWLNCDFRNGGKLWQQMMLWAMYTFFRLMGSIDASRLPGIEKYFLFKGYLRGETKGFYRNFVVAEVYRKTKIQ